MISNRSGSRRTGRSGGSARDSARDSARGTRRRDIEYAVDEVAGVRVFTSLADAFQFAVQHGGSTIEVLIYSEKGARDWGGDDAVDEFRSDPEDSVFQRIEINVTFDRMA